MSVTRSIRHPARLLTILCTALIITGCSSSGDDDDDGGAVVGPLTVSDAQPPVVQPPVQPEPPVVIQPPVQPEPPVVVQPVQPEPPVVVRPVQPEPPVVVQPPVQPEPPVVVQPPVQPEPPVTVPGGGSESFQALQRLQPATRFDYTNFSDGAEFGVTFDLTNAMLVDEGEDSALTQPFSDGGVLVCGFFPGALSTYFCADAFISGETFLTLFTLEANNTGTGSFFVCENLLTDGEFCIEQLFLAPMGSASVTAGVQPISALPAPTSAHLDIGVEYLQHLAVSEAAVTDRSSENVTEQTESVLRFLESTMSQ